MKSATAADSPGIFCNRARDFECAGPEPDLVTHLHAELHEQRRLEHGVPAVAKPGHRPVRRRDHVTVKRKSAVERAQLHEFSLSGTRGEIKLGRERHLAGHFAAERAEIGEGFLRKRLARGDREIGAQQGSRLQFDRALEVVAQRTDAHERRNAQDDGERKQHQPPPRGPRIPPRHLENESHEWPTEYTEHTESSEHEPLMFDSWESARS